MDFTKLPYARYRGSKRALLPFLHASLAPYQFDEALDLYSGSGMVSLLFRLMGKQVHANDFLQNCGVTARAFLHFDHDQSLVNGMARNLRYLLDFDSSDGEKLISHHFSGVFFTEEENNQLDLFCQKNQMLNPRQADLYRYLMSQACLKKRPYNLFDRADLATRLSDAPRASRNPVTWKAPFLVHAQKCLDELVALPSIQMRDHKVTNHDACELYRFKRDTQLVYVDPPCLDRQGRAFDYANGYHFLEGLCDYSLYGRADSSKAHLPIVSKSSQWQTLEGAKKSVRELAEHFDNGVIALSYRIDSQLTPSMIESLLTTPGRQVTIIVHPNNDDILFLSSLK